MYTKIITGLIISTALLTSVGAMEMATGSDSMMKKDDAMMMKDKMLKSAMPTSDAGMGSRGEHVTNIQKFLMEKGFFTLPVGAVHGYYGMMTKKAVMAYQESIGVNPTGFFGPKTRMMMQDKVKMMDDGKMMKDKMVQ